MTALKDHGDVSEIPHIPKLRQCLESGGGEDYWRSLEELGRTPSFVDSLHREFPEGASEWKDPTGRRHFLKLMGSSLALAGVHGCVSGPPQEHIVPYVDQAESVVPGRPSFYATSFPFRGYAQGVLVESHEARPTKIEGNPDHPASLGSTSAFAQASILDLYDTSRSTTPLLRGQPATIDRFHGWLQDELRRLRANDGRGLRILTETVTSPTLGRILRDFLREYPAAQWHTHDPVDGRNSEEGLQMVLDRPATPRYDLAEADVILSIDSDFLHSLPGSLRYAREWANRRRVRSGKTAMNRMYAVESTVTTTGAVADHRLPLRPSEVERFVRALASQIGISGGEVNFSGTAPASASDDGRWLAAVDRDLRESGARALIIGGETLPPELHALIHRMNERLGSVGTTVHYDPPTEERPPGGRRSLESLVRDMRSGAVDVLVMLGGNPVYTAPANLDVEQALRQVPSSVHLSLYRNETSFLTTWHIPRTHYLEEWGDLKAFDGTASIVQPLITPLYEASLSDYQVAAALVGRPGVAGYELVRETWRRRLPGGFEDAWREALRLGAITEAGQRASGEERPPDAEPPYGGEGESATGRRGERAVPEIAAAGAQRNAEREASELELVVRPDPTVWDGRYATNHWLQELPKPITKLVWDNAFLIAPQTAERIGVENEQMIEISVGGRSVSGPIWKVPGHPPDTVTAHLGYGRARAGDQASGSGFNAYMLRSSGSSWAFRGASLRVLEERRQLVSTQHHHSMEGRDLVEEASIEEFRRNPTFIHGDELQELPTLLPDYEYPRNKWGMAIDLNVCTGCSACVTACQAENNIPVVGKAEVGRGREMHWLRVDRYYKGSPEAPETFFQPIPCMHCEKAPCEVVCPVYATVHDAEGLNVMVYNRCIGTRYCSNNCPYKVRRFNFLQYADWDKDTEALQKNPDVTVRSRGVMEKCTYCIQRISAARIRAKKEKREIRDGEVRTACQAACPTEAIVFGDLANEDSRVSEMARQPQNYELLGGLGTRPRTSYLPHFWNRSEEIDEQGSLAGAGQPD